MLDVDIVDKVKIMLLFLQALVMFKSPPGWVNLFIEVGETQIGMDIS